MALGLGIGGLYAFGGPYAYCDPYNPYVCGYCGPYASVVHNDGTTERWRQPRLARWEKPRRDPGEPRPSAPGVAARRRAARRRWRVRQRARKATQLAAASDDATGGDIAA